MARRAQKDVISKGILMHQGESNEHDTLWPQNVKVLCENLLKDLNLNSDAVPKICRNSPK